MKKSLSAIFSLIILCIVSFSANAYEPSSILLCMSSADNVPENSQYIELLVLKEDLGEKYLLPSSDTKSEIALFNKDGFVSYTYRCKDAVSSSSFEEMSDDGFYTNYFGKEGEDLFYSLHIIKFAYVDKDGNILSLTNPVNTLYFGIFNVIFPAMINGSDASLDLTNAPPELLRLAIFAVIPVIAILLIIYFCKTRK